MKIHILTLSWNGLDKLKVLRKQLNYQIGQIVIDPNNPGKRKPGIEFCWHLRDNGSSDGTVKAIEGWKFLSDCSLPIEVHSIKHNRDNFATGMNYLFHEANPDDKDLILLLNNDVEFINDQSLLKMYNLALRNEVGIVGGRLLYFGGNKLQHAGVIFGPRYGNMPYHYRHNEESDEQAEKNRYFQAVTFACCFIKASEFKRINGFDENFKWAFDDIDFCLNVNSNKKIIYCGETTIYHEESATLKKNPVNKLFMNDNVKYFKQKWTGKYKLDHELYLKDKNYNLVK